LQNGLKNSLNLLIMIPNAVFQFGKFACKFFVHSHRLSKPDKDSHNSNVDLDRRSLFKTLDNMATPCSVKT
jgi:hypothetical protein